jgi:hypothetical protein
MPEFSTARDHHGDDRDDEVEDIPFGPDEAYDQDPAECPDCGEVMTCPLCSDPTRTIFDFLRRDGTISGHPVPVCGKTEFRVSIGDVGSMFLISDAEDRGDLLLRTIEKAIELVTEDTKK